MMQAPKGVIGNPRPRYSTEAFADSVTIPQEQFAFARTQAVPSRTLDGLKAKGVLTKMQTASGGTVWVVVYPPTGREA